MPRLEEAIDRSLFIPSAESYVPRYRFDKVAEVARSMGCLVDSLSGEGFHIETGVDFYITKCGAIDGYNRYNFLKRSQNKILTLEEFGSSEVLRIPDSIYIHTGLNDDEILDKFIKAQEMLSKGKMVLKPNYGSLNDSVSIHSCYEELIRRACNLLLDRRDIILQEYIEGDEYRIVTLKDEILAVIENSDMYKPKEELKNSIEFQDVAEEIYVTSGLNFCEADVIRNDNGFFLLETNDFPNIAYINQFIPGFDTAVYRRIIEDVIYG